ncbi:phosphonate metabolism protein/1,5-bisphosphokinase (PRPP-forming) PhnN [Microbacterium karelineae]|uniref:phosphonate metabolism protein/1,5-bisphosphokinase (PRPP-forming) PhnN n=1 Tax=Microbacterium karelineae TaxID=2654283 RepID=UPI0012E9A4B0|nr:phosphonate metabolism protein/1,5-bisphosphokinase (PRPP-forming) PhnN [Microbacterium karelineae]
MTGAFVAIVGPSGSGKDTILGYARDALAAEDAFVFPRRCVTRPSGPGEDHEPVASDAFASAEARGDFALTWRAHGLGYGIPASVRGQIDAGRIIVANISRGSVGEARAAFARVVVVCITAPAEVRLARILARGREDEAAARARIARASPRVAADLEIVNDGTVDAAGATLVGFLRALR